MKTSKKTFQTRWISQRASMKTLLNQGNQSRITLLTQKKEQKRSCNDYKKDFRSILQIPIEKSSKARSEKEVASSLKVKQCQFSTNHLTSNMKMKHQVTHLSKDSSSSNSIKSAFLQTQKSLKRMTQSMMKKKTFNQKSLKF